MMDHGNIPGTRRLIELPVVLAQLWRLHACITAGIGVLVAAHLAGLSLTSALVINMVITVFIITGAGNTLNDYFDRDIDGINRGLRPIPSSRVSRATALVIAAISFAAGILFSLFVTIWVAVFAVLNSVILVIYDKFSKQLGIYKNLIVAYLVGSLFLLGASGYQLLSLPLVILSVCAMLATLAREIAKDIEDLKGDLAFGARTLPAIKGTDFSRNVVGLALASAALLALLPYLLGHMDQTYLFITLAGDGIFLVAYLNSNAAIAQRVIMIGSVIQLCAFIFGASPSLN